MVYVRSHQASYWQKNSCLSKAVHFFIAPSLILTNYQNLNATTMGFRGVRLVRRYTLKMILVRMYATYQ